MIVVGVKKEDRGSDVTNMDVRLKMEVHSIKGPDEDVLEVRHPTVRLGKFVLANLE